MIPGIAVGLNKGTKVTQMTPAPKISYKKGAASNRTKFVRSLVREIAGLSPRTLFFCYLVF